MQYQVTFPSVYKGICLRSPFSGKPRLFRKLIWLYLNVTTSKLLNSVSDNDDNTPLE